VHASTGIAWEDFSATVREVFIPPDTVNRLKLDWELLQIKGGEHVSACDERFRVLRRQLEPHVPLSDERLRDSYQFKLESNPEASKALIEKLGNQSTALLNDVMEHVS
jgi:hypothetical protein